MKKKKYLKLILTISIICLVLTTSWCFIEISDLKKEKEDISKQLTILQEEKKELIRDYWKLANLSDQRTLEYEKEIIEFKKKHETETKIESYTENLTPAEIVKKFLEADINGSRSDKEIKKYYTLSSGFPTDFAYEGDFAMVIKKYEILDEYPSENDNSYFVKVKYFCKNGTASGSMGIPNEIKKMNFVIVPCNAFFKEICPRCFEEPTKVPYISFNFQEETQTIIFKLIQEKNQWKLNSPSVCPHISEETFEKYLNKYK